MSQSSFFQCQFTNFKLVFPGKQQQGLLARMKLQLSGNVQAIKVSIPPSPMFVLTRSHKYYTEVTVWVIIVSYETRNVLRSWWYRLIQLLLLTYIHKCQHIQL